MSTFWLVIFWTRFPKFDSWYSRDFINESSASRYFVLFGGLTIKRYLLNILVHICSGNIRGTGRDWLISCHEWRQVFNFLRSMLTLIVIIGCNYFEESRCGFINRAVKIISCNEINKCSVTYSNSFTSPENVAPCCLTTIKGIIKLFKYLNTAMQCKIKYLKFTL